VLARIAPAKARTGIEGYFAAWKRAVRLFGRGQVSTYVILGMGEDEDTTVEGCMRAIDIGVYPFVVPLRPVPGSLMEACSPPPPETMESVYRRVVPHLQARGLRATSVRAGCARCQACSAIGVMERSIVGDHGRIPLRPLR
jgi:biotin synthase-related radical SAM superfamily protein